MNKIFLITDNIKTEKSIHDILDGYEIETLSAQLAVLKIPQEAPDLVVIDCDIKEKNALDIYRKIKMVNPLIPAIMLSGTPDIPLVVAATKMGAASFLAKPLDPNKLSAAVTAALAGTKTPASLSGSDAILWLKGGSVIRRALFEDLLSISASLDDVNIAGEIGINKREAAELIHRNSIKKGKFKEINLSAFQKEEDEPGFWAAFKNIFAPATVYLSGFDAIPEHFRESLVQFLSARKNNIKFDKEIRVILESISPQEKLAAFKILHLPALRFRKEDLFLMVAARIEGRAAGIGTDLVQFLTYYDFPGNFAELEELLSAGLVKCSGGTLRLSDLTLTAEMFKREKKNEFLGCGTVRLEQARIEFEKAFFGLVLRQANDNVSSSCRFLDIPKETFTERLEQLGLDA